MTNLDFFKTKFRLYDCLFPLVINDLFFNRIQINHSGRWKVTATNPIGSDSVIIEILVTGTPKSPSQPGNNLIESSKS
jgi:hypothetical protein